MMNAVFDILVLGLPHLHSRGTVTGAVRSPAAQVNGGALVAGDADVIEAARDIRVEPEPGVGAALAAGMAQRGLRAAWLDCGQHASERSALDGLPAPAGVHRLPPLQAEGAADAHRYSLTDAEAGYTSLCRYGAVDPARARQAAMLAGSAKLLCLEDTLWDMQGGAHLAEVMIAAAHRAGRRVALACRDAEAVHRNRAAIRRLADTRIDFLVGEVQALVALYDFQRLDSLMPHLRLLGRGGVVWRPSHPPLVFDGDSLSWRKCETPPTAGAFWASVLPEYLAEIARTGTLEAYAPPGPTRQSPPRQSPTGQSAIRQGPTRQGRAPQARAFPTHMRPLEQFQKKCEAVFRSELLGNNTIEHFRDSERNGNTLSVAPVRAWTGDGESCA